MPRKAPSEHARLFDVGEQKKGNDGEMWEIIEFSKGIKRWKRSTERKKFATKSRKKQKKHQRKTRKHHKR